MATVALVMEPASRHRAEYLEAVRDVGDIADVLVVDVGAQDFDQPRAVIPDKLRETYAAVEDMLRAESPVMAIVTMVGAHAPPAIRRLLEAGVPVMAEKPACVNPDDFAALVELAERKHVHLMLALANRLNPWVQDARRVFHGNGIGELRAVRGLHLASTRRLWDPQLRDWVLSKAEAGGGYLIWLAIHWLDLMTFITGERVAAVQAMAPNVSGAPIDVEDVALVNLRLAGGGQGSLTCGYLLDEGYQLDLGFWGSDGWLRFEAGGDHALRWHSALPAMNDSPDRRFSYTDFKSGYTPWVRETLRAALGEIEPPITGAEGLAVLRAVHAAYESARTGRTVRL